MLVEQETQHIKRLKILLPYKYLLILILIIIYSLISTKYSNLSSVFNGDETFFQGKITEYLIDGDKVSFELNTSLNEKLKCVYYVKDIKEKNFIEEHLKYGITVEINGSLNEPSNNTIPNTFNYKKYLNNKKIFYTTSVNSIDFIEDENLLYKIKNKFIESINKIPQKKEYIIAFVVGNKNMLDNDIFEAYKDNGVTHLFAISGMHITLFAGVIDKLLKLFKVKENKRLVFISLFLVFYWFFFLYQKGFSICYL